MNKHYLIIGNGAAGVSAAEVIRQRDAAATITILTDEPHLMYSRPGIAYVLLGQVPPEQIISRRRAFYAEHRFDLRFGRATRLDTTQQQVTLTDGAVLGYDVLLLAIGAAATPATFTNGQLEGIVTFDKLDDTRHILTLSRKARAAVIVGGGITAMELAEGIVRQGVKTHFLQRGGRLWPRLLNQDESDIIEHQIKHEGIHLHYNEEIVEAVGKKGRVVGVKLKSGRELPCDIIGVAIGVKPNLELIKGTPIQTKQGILVNQHMQSNIPTLFAAGDVAQVYDRWTQGHQLDILWPSAIAEGRAAGYNMVDVAHNRPLSYPYQKGSPFNAALLFGIHMTVIGQISDNQDKDAMLEAMHLSRGASFVWTAPFGATVYSAWDKNGPNSMRVALDRGRIIGALILGNQDLAEPLRYLIEHEVNVTAYQEAILNSGRDLPHLLTRLWHETATPR
ncbi:MAG: FAD-dependent oxidoreductase [Chloroflexi bacterium]|nr:FAD-dependent oxidoreductase [Chloroflexota bacterium]MBP8056767.1 FAD-dependent oxidoreductase [Chloroflexota bacterium]